MTSADTERAFAPWFRIERFTAAQRRAGDLLAALRVRVRDVALMLEIAPDGRAGAEPLEGLLPCAGARRR